MKNFIKGKKGAQKIDPEIRFWEKVVLIPFHECWEWVGSSLRGYGQMFVNGKQMKAHRWSYKFFNNQDPGDLYVCHRCDNPSCVNPRHLFLGTQSDNIKDCYEKGRRLKKTSCPNGHLFSKNNITWVGPHKTYKVCKICARTRENLAAKKRREALEKCK